MADAWTRRPVVEYGAIPYRITHPGKECDSCRTRRRPSGSPESPVCEGTPEYREVRQRGVPVEDLTAAARLPHDLHLDVHARRVAAHRLQHAVPVDLRQQHRGLDGPAPLRRSSICSGAWRRRSRRSPYRPGLDRAPGRGERRDRGGAGRLRAAVSARAGADAVLRLLHLHPRDSGDGAARPVDLARSSCRRSGSSRRPSVGGGGGVAYFAHIGGFLFGLAAIKLFAQAAQQPSTGPQPKYPVY